MSVRPLHTPLGELNGDIETAGDNPAWLEAVDSDIRTDVRGCIAGAVVGLVVVALIAAGPSIIAFVGGVL